MCSEAKADAHRFRTIIHAAIDDKKVKQYKKFKPWSEKVAKQPCPKAPLAPRKANASGAEGGEKQLIQQIRCNATRQEYPDRPSLTLVVLPKAGHTEYSRCVERELHVQHCRKATGVLVTCL